MDVQTAGTLEPIGYEKYPGLFLPAEEMVFSIRNKQPRVIKDRYCRSLTMATNPDGTQDFRPRSGVEMECIVNGSGLDERIGISPGGSCFTATDLSNINKRPLPGAGPTTARFIGYPHGSNIVTGCYETSDGHTLGGVQYIDDSTDLNSSLTSTVLFEHMLDSLFNPT